jgi:hypothetical protein
MAGATGLEPATSGVTGRHSNQLSYAPAGDGDDRPSRTARELRDGRRQVKLNRRNCALSSPMAAAKDNRP